MTNKLFHVISICLLILPISPIPIIKPYPQTTICQTLPCHIDLTDDEQLYFHDDKHANKLSIFNGYVQGYMDRTVEFKKPEFIFSFVGLGEIDKDAAFNYNFYVRDDWKYKDVADLKPSSGPQYSVSAGVVDTSFDFGQRVNDKISDLVQRGLKEDDNLSGFFSKTAIVITFYQAGTSGQHNLDQFQIILSKGNFNGDYKTNMFLCLFEDLEAQKMHGIYRGSFHVML